MRGKKEVNDALTLTLLGIFQASDKLHTATTDLIIRILDENDNAPEFSQQSYQVRLDFA